MAFTRIVPEIGPRGRGVTLWGVLLVLSLLLFVGCTLSVRVRVGETGDRQCAFGQRDRTRRRGFFPSSSETFSRIRAAPKEWSAFGKVGLLLCSMFRGMQRRLSLLSPDFPKHCLLGHTVLCFWAFFLHGLL